MIQRSATRLRNPYSVLVVVVAAIIVGGLLPHARSEPTHATPVTVTIDDEEFLLSAMVGTEAVSDLFRFELDLTAPAPGSPDPATLVGAAAAWQLVDDAGHTRAFSGMVSRLAAGPEDESGRRRYRAVVVPRAWLLTQTADNRLFQEKSAVEVVSTVLAEHGVDVESELGDDYPTRSCVVQWNETDWDFVSRLLQEEGIFFAFEHSTAGTTLRLDDDSTNQTVEPAPAVDEWVHEFRFVPARVTLGDFNFITPGDTLEVQADSSVSQGDPARFEVYSYPGGHSDEPSGLRRAHIGVHASDVNYETGAARATAPGFAPGHTFRLDEHSSRFSGAYYVTTAEHRYQPATGYSVALRFVPAETPYRPQRQTPRPEALGVQSAVVVGPAGETINTDEYGRIKVQFHWDRHGQQDENSSCWIRTAQPWSQSPGTAFHVPRVGSEVLVAFEHGDINRPVVIGRLWNSRDLPDPHRWKAAR